MPPWPSADPDPPGLPADAAAVLLPLARAAVAAELGIDRPADDSPRWLAEPGACFVTLHTAGRLHGCIGTIWPTRPLREDVRENARAAATRDRRFPPLTRPELADTVIEVSVLSPTEPIAAGTEAQVLAALRPGLDGVVLECGRRRATLLPQVWSTLADPQEFLAHLRVKAGLPRDFWSTAVRVSRYAVTELREER